MDTPTARTLPESRACFVGIDERIRAVDQKQVDMVSAHIGERGFDRGRDVSRRGVIIFHVGCRVPANRGDDIAFGDDFEFVAQARGGFECVAENGFRRVAAIDIGLVHRRDTLGKARLDLGLHMLRRGVGIVTDAPHAVHQSAEGELRGNINALHQRRTPFPRGVAGISAGTRP